MSTADKDDLEEDEEDDEEDDDDERMGLVIQTEEDQQSVSSPLDLSTSDHFSSTSIKSDEEQQTPASIQFQMGEHEGEPEDPNMAKVRRRCSIVPTALPLRVCLSS